MRIAGRGSSLRRRSRPETPGRQIAGASSWCKSTRPRQEPRYGEHIYRLHLGTEIPAPTPVVEMHEGAGNVPGYRGLVYLTFDELPLKDFGNRMPNITAEIVAAGSIVHPSQHVDSSSQGGVGNRMKAGWLLDSERPYIVWGGWLLKVNRATGQLATASMWPATRPSRGWRGRDRKWCPRR